MTATAQDPSHQVRALNAIHQAFFETRKSLALVIIGVGNIGGTLLRQLHAQHAYLRTHGFDVKVIGLANSKRFVLSADGISLGRWRETLMASRRRMNPQALAERLNESVNPLDLDPPHRVSARPRRPPQRRSPPHVTGHAMDGIARFDGYSRVSRP